MIPFGFHGSEQLTRAGAPFRDAQHRPGQRLFQSMTKPILAGNFRIVVSPRLLLPRLLYRQCPSYLCHQD
jgi:hypothetical protein